MRAPPLRSYARFLSASIERVDCAGRVLIPGFVDSHTHAIFGKPRFEEQELRASGLDYMEIARRLRRNPATNFRDPQQLRLAHFVRCLVRHATRQVGMTLREAHHRPGRYAHRLQFLLPVPRPRIALEVQSP